MLTNPCPNQVLPDAEEVCCLPHQREGLTLSCQHPGIHIPLAGLKVTFYFSLVPLYQRGIFPPDLTWPLIKMCLWFQDKIFWGPGAKKGTSKWEWALDLKVHLREEGVWNQISTMLGIFKVIFITDTLSCLWISYKQAAFWTLSLFGHAKQASWTRHWKIWSFSAQNPFAACLGLQLPAPTPGGAQSFLSTLEGSWLSGNVSPSHLTMGSLWLLQMLTHKDSP